jgi:hypothetical protein
LRCAKTIDFVGSNEDELPVHAILLLWACFRYGKKVVLIGSNVQGQISYKRHFLVSRFGDWCFKFSPER